MSDDLRRRIVDLLPRLRRFARALTGDAERGDDLVQEACVRALARLDQFAEGTRLDSWMYRIAQNAWYDQVRARKVRGDVVDIETAHDLAGDDGRDITEHRMTLSVLTAAMEKLPAEQKSLVVLVCIEGLSYKEAAEISGVPLGTIMSRLARARRALYVAAHGEKPNAAVSELEKSGE